MKHTEGKLAGARNLSVYYQYWTPESAPKALLLLVHGAGEHSDRYRPLARYFTRHGYAIAALDHPNIVTVYSVDQADGLHFLTMELVQPPEFIPETITGPTSVVHI